MYKFILLVTTLFSLFPFTLAAHENPGYVSIPATAFFPGASVTVPRDSIGGAALISAYATNSTGTARFFQRSIFLFAPVNLPHGSRVDAFKCGAGSREPSSVKFVLRRNDPQQANVEMATVETNDSTSQFEHVRTKAITAPLVLNQLYNYYIVAEAAQETGSWVGYCNVSYRFVEGPILSIND